MIKIVLRCAAIGFALLCLFLLGPQIGKSIYFHLTPKFKIEELKAEYGTTANEYYRIKIARKLAQRGINVDDGIRDEAIEHNITPYTIFVMTCWQWEELLGI
jgi:hypothetical protein